MQYLSLNGAWNLFKSAEETSLPASVPGCVHIDLLVNGLLADPFFRDNELAQMWVGETKWRYKRTFDVPSELLDFDRVLLRCYGLDTLAMIRVNDTEVGRAENMFRTWEFDLKPVLHVGENEICIVLDAPMPFVRRMDRERGTMAGWVEPMRINSGAWIRKEPCNFGWDWGPKMVTSGIWRDIELIAFNTARLADVLVLQHHEDGVVRLTVQLETEQVRDEVLSAEISLMLAGKAAAHVDRIVLADGRAEVTFPVDNPQLWWVNGLGEQPLYDLHVSLQDAGGHTLDTWVRRIGLRTLTLERHPDEWGESFYFACNGVPFFAKGANWIPISPYPGHAQAEHYAYFVQAAAQVNMNMLRVWGGGIYEDNAFYESCDQYGIAVWQDFMFACGTYPSLDQEFMANVKAEAIDNVRRLRHHACMALWCGNNEIEQGLPDSEGWLETMSWEDYSRLFDVLLANVVREMAPQTAYWPGSPHSPIGDRSDHRNPGCGDTHLWDVWHGMKPFEWYRTRPDRFVSEFGFQSFPEPRVVNEFTLPEDRNITSYVMEHHQRSGIGNSTIIHYMLDWFRLPTSFESTLWLSQILQGMAMKYAVEGWRRNMPRSMGALYWQLNDMWPAPSWSSLDWKGNWKALHYMAKRFFAPILVSGVEDTEKGTVTVVVTNDTQRTRSGIVQCLITDAQGKAYERDSFRVSVPPCTSTTVYTLNVGAHLELRSPRDVLVWMQLYIDDAVVSEDLVLFCRPKHLTLSRPHISMEVHPLTIGEYSIVLSTDAIALYVWLEQPGARFEDNFVHLRPGHSRTIHVAAMDISDLRVYSLVDTYQ